MDEKIRQEEPVQEKTEDVTDLKGETAEAGSESKEADKAEAGSASRCEDKTEAGSESKEADKAEAGSASRCEEKTEAGSGSKEADKPEARKKPAKKVRKKKTAKQLALSFFIKIAVTALIIWVICTYVIGIYVVHTNTSYPMLKDGDLCIVYRLGQIYTGDEVVYSMEGKTCFGRVVAMPGDVVEIGDDGMTVNGYGVFEDTVYPTTGEGATITFPYTVPEGSYFVLNDYRADATDSRIYGAIPKKKVKGKIVFLMRRRGF